MDYSIHDAKEAGFNKVVFIIRKDIFKEFEEIIGNRIKEQIDVEYVFQELDDLPEGFEVPEGRTKPWGTGQAVLCCKDVVKEPFVIINADDYYGKEAFVKLHDFLAEDFKDFLANVEEGELKSEYLLPNIVDKLLKEERANVKVLETQDRWFGVTYKEDKETVQEAFKELISDGVYAEKLWE